MPRSVDLFRASDYSIEENLFLLEHLGEPVLVALNDGLPRGVNEHAVRPFIARTFELDALQQARRVPWVGFPAVKSVIARYVEWHRQTQIMKERTKHHRDARVRLAASIPSLCAWDGGRPFLNAIGADSGQVLTAIEADGTRTPLYLDLRQPLDAGIIPDMADVAPWMQHAGDGAAQANALRESTPAALVEKVHGTRDEFGSFECPLCGHAQEFKQGNQPSKAGALARMMKHLKTAKDDKERHMILYQRVRDGKPTTKAGPRAMAKAVGAGATTKKAAGKR